MYTTSSYTVIQQHQQYSSSGGAQQVVLWPKDSNYTIYTIHAAPQCACRGASAQRPLRMPRHAHTNTYMCWCVVRCPPLPLLVGSEALSTAVLLLLTVHDTADYLLIQ